MLIDLHREFTIVVAAQKPKSENEISLCVDIRDSEPNKHINREERITPSIVDMVLDLNGATVFLKCGLKMDIIS